MDLLLLSGDWKYWNNYYVHKSGYILSSSGREVRGTLQSRGYRQTTGKNRKRYLIHRIVASAWCPRECCAARVNHIDGNKTNNHPSNLEWVSLW